MPTSGVSENTIQSFRFNLLATTALMPNITVSEVHLAGRGLAKRYALLPLSVALGLCFTIAQQAKADFIGAYALTNFTLTNTDNGGFPSFTNGTATTSDGGQTIVLTGGNGGSGFAGTTDLFINAIASGIVQFNWSYSSSDPSSTAYDPLSLDYLLGCGQYSPSSPQFTGPCDDGGYLLDGNYTQLADDSHQGLGQVTFSVTAGETFGFAVNTVDNTGGAGILTISDFSAPVPEPSFPAVLLGLTAAIAGAQRRRARSQPTNRGENQ